MISFLAPTNGRVRLSSRQVAFGIVEVDLLNLSSADNLEVRSSQDFASQICILATDSFEMFR